MVHFLFKEALLLVKNEGSFWIHLRRTPPEGDTSGSQKTQWGCLKNAHPQECVEDSFPGSQRRVEKYLESTKLVFSHVDSMKRNQLKPNLFTLIVEKESTRLQPIRNRQEPLLCLGFAHEQHMCACVSFSNCSPKHIFMK